MRLAVSVALTVLCTSMVHGQTARIAVDPRAEAIGILFRLAGASDFSNGTVQPYIRRIDSAFAPFRDHPVFQEINRLRRQSGLSLSSVTTMAPQITDPVTFGERAPIDAPSSALAGGWRGAEARTFLRLARDFARVSRFGDFLRAQQELYDSAGVRMGRLVEGNQLEWIGRFFGGPSDDVYVVAPLLINSRGNFAADFRAGAIQERYAFLGVQFTDASGFPVIPAGVFPIVVHEIAHSFVNPVVGAHATALRPAGERIFPLVQRSMRSLAYESWPSMFNESVVRAAVIRYLLANRGPAAAGQETRMQQGGGFVWMDELVELLGEYESRRSVYPTLAAFMPRIVEYYGGLAPRLDGLVAGFQLRRPRIVSASIRDSATDVDPRLGTLVIRFDRAVTPIIALVGNHGGGTPELTAATFDTAHTTLTLGIKLEPGRDYVLPLGPGAFVGRDGYPLQEFRLRFRTAGPPE